MLIRIAWRNIWRHRTRSLVIMLSVALGLWAGIFLMAFYFGLGEQRVRSAIQQEISHLQLHHSEFKKDYDLKYRIPSGDSLLARLQKDTLLKAFGGRTILQAMVSTASGSAGVQVNGIVPDEEAQLTMLKEKVHKGTYFLPGKKNQILIGEKLARKLKLKPGSKTVLTFQDAEGTLTAGAFRVIGIYQTNNGPYDEGNVFVLKENLNEIAGIPGSTNEVAILLKSNDDLIKVYDGLKKAYPELQIETWKELSPETDMIISSVDQMMYIFMGIILFALAFGIVNTMLMSILERTREIGMLMALGMTKLKIFKMIMMETTFLVFAGCPAGLLIAFISIFYFGKHGIALNVYGESFSSFGFDRVVYPHLEPRHYLIMLVLVWLTALFSSLLPARKALQLNPSEAIRK